MHERSVDKSARVGWWVTCKECGHVWPCPTEREKLKMAAAAEVPAGEKMYAVFEVHPINQQATLWTDGYTAERLLDLIRRRKHFHPREFKIFDYPLIEGSCNSMLAIASDIDLEALLLPLPSGNVPIVYIDEKGIQYPSPFSR